MAIKQKVGKIKGVADILFCIDFSGSMTPCIEGVKSNINAFISSLETSNPNMVVDWQIGFCSYDSDLLIISELDNDAKSFTKHLGKLSTRGQEFTPGAIDYCISEFKWRDVSNKYLVLFTDEPLVGGDSNDNGDGSSKFDELLDKITNSKVWFYFFGPKCSYYEKFEKISRTYTEYIEYDFSSVDFSSLLNSLGKTVSQSCGQQNTRSLPSDLDLIYNFKNIQIQKL